MKPGDLVRFKQGRWGRLLSGKIGLVINVRAHRNNQESFAIDALVNGKIWCGMAWNAESMEVIE